MVAGIGAWVKKNYDRIIAAAVLLVLLVSLVLLAVQAQAQKRQQKLFDQELGLLKPRFKTALPVDKAIFENTLTALTSPFQAEPWALSLLTPEVRVACTNCARPIPYSATNCTFSMCGVAQPAEVHEIVDRNHNGIPDEWEEKNGVFAFDAETINADPDNDGFTTREEYEWKTDPKSPDDHPPYLAKVRVSEIKPIPFRMVFKAVSKAGGKLIFQINLRSGGRTYWKSLGEKAETFTLLSYNEKAPEGPTLTLEQHGKQIPLIKGQVVPRDDYEIRLISLIDATPLPVVRPDVEFMFKGAKYRVKKVDTLGKRVLISDPSRGIDVWIERQMTEAEPERKP